MATKSVTIELTPKQKEKLRKLTGQAHAEIRVDVSRGRTRKPLTAKAAPATKIALPPDGGGAGTHVGFPME